MLILAAHTSSPFLGVAVTNEEKIIAEEILAPGREHLENISGTIYRVMSKCGLELPDLDGLAVVTGPGSFSGIRVGLSVIKGLAMALNTRLLGVSALETLTWQSVKDGQIAIPLIDAGRGEVYTGIYKKQDNSVQTVRSPRLLNKNDLVRFISDKGSLEITVCGAPDLIDPLVVEPSLTVKTVTAPSPGACGILAEKRLVLGSSDDIHSLTPLYMRRSDAETNRSA